MSKRILIVGAGFAGATIARHLAEAGNFEITVIDSRDHIGGNAYDYENEHGIRVHKYGPHIFHTNNKTVVDWLSQFTEWIPYQHKVKAMLADGRYVTLPVNRETKEIVGEENVVDIFMRPYTKKMWNKEIEELDPAILQRVPIRDDMNELYFPNDEYQFMPKDGYTAIFTKIFDHENISIKLNTSFDKSMESDYDFIFNSMPIDVYFDMKYGELPYRSIKFHHVNIPAPKLLPVPCVNYTHTGPYTRMTEWKGFPNHGDNSSMTSITYEEPCDYKDNNLERYYPVKDIDGVNREIYKKYRDETPPNMEFVGRTGMYIYTDMHMAIGSSMATAKQFIKNFKGHQ
jgi:UDP-galactopyranose mutase